MQFYLISLVLYLEYFTSLFGIALFAFIIISVLFT